MTAAALAAAFVFGFAGSLHCVGMCGPLVLLLAQDRPSVAQLHLRQALYYSGKTGAYALLGAIAGTLGAGLGGLFAGMQDTLSIVLGVVLIGMGIGLLRNARWLEGGGALARLPGFRAAVAFFMRRRSPGSTLALGFLNGFLPCGLVYAALAMAVASGSALGGAPTMAAFGLATVPALFAVVTFGSLLRSRWRAGLSWLAGLVAVVAGAVTALRGTPWMEHVVHLLTTPERRRQHSTSGHRRKVPRAYVAAGAPPHARSIAQEEPLAWPRLTALTGQMLPVRAASPADGFELGVREVPTGHEVLGQRRLVVALGRRGRRHP